MCVRVLKFLSSKKSMRDWSRLTPRCSLTLFRIPTSTMQLSSAWFQNDYLTSGKKKVVIKIKTWHPLQRQKTSRDPQQISAYISLAEILLTYPLLDAKMALKYSFRLDSYNQSSLNFKKKKGHQEWIIINFQCPSQPTTS